MVRESKAKPCTGMKPRLFDGRRDGLVIFTVVSVSGKPLFRTRCNAVYKLYTLPTTEYAQETMHCPLLPDLFVKCCYYAVFCSLGTAELVVCAAPVWSRTSLPRETGSSSPSFRHDAFNTLVTVPTSSLPVMLVVFYTTLFSAVPRDAGPAARAMWGVAHFQEHCFGVVCQIAVERLRFSRLAVGGAGGEGSVWKCHGLHGVL